MKRFLTIIAIIVAAGIVITALTYATGKKKSPTTNTNKTTTQANSDASSNNTGTTPATTVKTINITSNGFEPSTLTVKVGTIVRWVNKDTGEHTVTSKSDNGPASTAFGNNIVYAFTFSAPGTFDYNSMVDKTGFNGTVTVTR